MGMDMVMRNVERKKDFYIDRYYNYINEISELMDIDYELRNEKVSVELMKTLTGKLIENADRMKSDLIESYGKASEWLRQFDNSDVIVLVATNSDEYWDSKDEYEQIYNW